MGKFNRNKKTYVQLVGFNASFQEAKTQYETGELSKAEYISQLKTILKEFETLGKAENNAEFIKYLSSIISD